MGSLSLEEQLKKATDPTVRSELRRKAHAQAKDEQKRGLWNDESEYLVQSCWKEAVSVTYLPASQIGGYITEMLHPGKSLMLKGYQLSEQLKGLAIPRKSRKNLAVVSITLMTSTGNAEEAVATTTSAEDVPSSGPKNKRKKKDAEVSDLSSVEMKALEEGSELP